MTRDVLIKKMLCKFDEAFAEYHDSLVLSNDKVTPQVTQALVKFIHYRSDFLEITTKLSFMGILDHDTAWMMDCYCDYMTYCAKVFEDWKDHKPSKEDKKKLMNWVELLNY